MTNVQLQRRPRARGWHSPSVAWGVTYVFLSHRSLPMSINCRLQAVDAATTVQLAANPVRAPLSLARAKGVRCDIHKAWHAIHYVLTGSADGGEPPDCYLLDGGTALGPPGD